MCAVADSIVGLKNLRSRAAESQEDVVDKMELDSDAEVESACTARTAQEMAFFHSCESAVASSKSMEE